MPTTTATTPTIDADALKSKDFLTAAEAAQLVGVSKPTMYKVFRKLNKELADKGYITFSGRVPTDYLLRRVGLKK